MSVCLLQILIRIPDLCWCCENMNVLTQDIEKSYVLHWKDNYQNDKEKCIESGGYYCKVALGIWIT